MQIGVNTQLAKALGHPVKAAFASFSIGLVAVSLLLAVLLQAAKPAQAPSVALPALTSLPFYYWLGGLVGASFVLSSIYISPRLGATLFGALIVLGQMSGAVLLDHMGLLGYTQQAISWPRALGLMLLVAGVWLIRKV
jgi:bacterial/archaeal transporter family-2 protein